MIQIYRKISDKILNAEKVMKKIIESDLISIAHRILKLKDKSDVATLLKETELLHNKLVLLQFYEDNKFRLDPSISEEKLFELANYTATNQDNEQQPVVNQPDYMSADIVNDLLEDAKNTDVVSFEEEIITPIDLDVNAKEFAGNDDVLEVEDEVETTNETLTNDDLLNTEDEVLDEVAALGEPEEAKLEVENEEEVFFTPSIDETQKTLDEVEDEIEELEETNPIEDAKEAVERAVIEIDPVFSVAHTEIFNQASVASATQVSAETEEKENATQHFFTNQTNTPTNENYRQAPLNKSINDAFAHKIAIGLNDRIAFEKNLFNGNGDDLNRVISQLNTIETYQEAKDFIEDLVKPEFNDWRGKEDYENRFMELVEKRFL